MTAVAAQVPVVIDLGGRDVFCPSAGRVLARVEVEDGEAVRCTASGATAAAGEVIPLPVVGESVRVPTDDGIVSGVWVERVVGSHSHLDERDGLVTGWLMTDGGMSTARHRAGEWDARRTVTTAPDPVLVYALGLLVAEREGRQAEQLRHERWREQLVERAHSEADHRDWCSDFDDFMADLGLPGRSRDFSVAVDVSLRLYVTMSAQNADAAEESVDTSDVMDAIRDYDLHVDDWTTDGAERS